MIAVVLAGGRGTRLGGDVPKPLVPVAGVPAIDRILAALNADGFQEIVVVSGHRSDELERHLSAYEPSVRFARQHQPLGTADAFLAARDAIGGQPFLVAWADVLVPRDTYRDVAAAAAGRDGAVLVNRLDDLSAGGAVEIDGGLVTGITEKPKPVAGWNLTGVLCLSSDVWEHVVARELSPRGEYELPEAIDAWVKAGAKIGAVDVDGPVFEIGTPEGLAAASAYWSDDSRAS